MHNLNHLERSSCSVCHESLVLIGNVWYGPHTHSEFTNIEIDDPAKTDEYKTTTFVNGFDEFQFDPLSTKIEKDSICDTHFDDGISVENSIEHEHIATDLVKPENAERSETPTESCNALKETETKVKRKRSQRQRVPSKSNISSVKRQQRSSTSTKKCWKCKLCNEEFSFEANLIEHQDEHEKGSLQQDTPSFVVGSAATYERKSELSDDSFHIRSKCTDPSAAEDDNLDILTYDDIKTLSQVQLNSLKCSICNKKLESQRGLKSHLRMHKTVYTCKLCKCLFSTMEIYRTHASRAHGTVAKKSQTSTAVSTPSTSIFNKKIDSNSVDWICEYCNKDFESELNLAKHLLKEHGADKSEHMCNICEAKFAITNDLLAHMRGHSESNQHKCSVDGCNHGFAYKASLIIHLSKHETFDTQSILRKTQNDLSGMVKQYAALSVESSTDLDLKCSVCSKELESRATLLLHIQSMHMKNEIRCKNNKCTETFSSAKRLYEHLRSNHSDALHKCDVCDKVIYSKVKFIAHQQRHGAPKSCAGSFECDICSKTFNNKTELRAHFRIHDKYVSCTLCDEKFLSIKVMKAHRERHGKKPMLKCRYQNCDQIFESRREFMKHALEHPEVGKKRFICPHCGKSLSRTYIADHINTHTKAVSWPCTYCDKSFVKKTSLRRHLLIHTNTKPYVCDIDGCGQAYRESIDLKRHKFSAHKIYTKKHICSICSQVFPERKLLTKHTIHVHGKIDQTIPVQSH